MLLPNKTLTWNWVSRLYIDSVLERSDQKRLASNQIHAIVFPRYLGALLMYLELIYIDKYAKIKAPCFLYWCYLGEIQENMVNRVLPLQVLNPLYQSESCLYSFPNHASRARRRSLVHMEQCWNKADESATDLRYWLGVYDDFMMSYSLVNWQNLIAGRMLMNRTWCSGAIWQSFSSPAALVSFQKKMRAAISLQWTHAFPVDPFNPMILLMTVRDGRLLSLEDDFKVRHIKGAQEGWL